MRKKGFTLIELLAVIAVLAILVLLALPRIVDLFRQAKYDAFETEVKEIYKQAQTDWINDSLKVSGARVYSRIDGEACVNELNLSGGKDTDYIIEMDSNGNITRFRVSDKNYQLVYNGTGLKIEDINNTSVVDIYKLTDRQARKFQCVSGIPSDGTTYAEYIEDIDNYGDVAVTIRGSALGTKMKILANPTKTVTTVDYEDSNIRAIVRSTTPPSENNKKDINRVTGENSEYEAYMWFDNGTIYWWSETGTLTLNQDAAHMFYSMNNLVDIDSLRYFDTSNTKIMLSLFAHDTKITSIEPLKDWDTSNLEHLEFAFYNMSSLTSIEPIRNWDTSHVKRITGLLSNSKSVKSLEPIKGWDVSKVTHFNSAFNYMYSLTEIDLNGWDTSSAVSMNSMFDDCINVTRMDVSTFDTSNVTDMGWMFNQLTSLKELDISNFDTRKVTSFQRMFNNSINLETIYVGDYWDTSKNTAEAIYVFPTPSKLPNYNSSNSNRRNIMYAKYTTDGGYLTYKPNNQ